MTRFDLTKYTALVTGSTQGIGFEIALAFAEAGATVVLHGLEADRHALDWVRELAPRSVMLAADLSAPGAAKALAAQGEAEVGGLDIVVHAASIQHLRGFHEIQVDEAQRQWLVNCWAAVELFQHAVPAMARNGWGRLIAIGSVQQLKPHPEMIAYASSKTALAGVMRSLAHEFASAGITANTIAPGVINTPRNAKALADPDYAGAIAASIPAGYVGEPSDICGAALLLAGDAGRYINGQTLFVDGFKSY